MPETRKVYVLGVTDLDGDEDEALRDLGQGIALTGKQLVTAKGLAGVAQAVAWGFDHAGGTTQYIDTGTIPDSRDVLIFASPLYEQRVRERVPDVDDRGWTIIPRQSVHQFHQDILTALAEKGIHLPKYKGGG